MIQIDPTTAVAESNTNSKEELSVDVVAQIQEFQTTHGETPRRNGVPTNGATAEQTPVLTTNQFSNASLPKSAVAPQIVPIAPPMPPIHIPPLPLGPVSGRYRSTGPGYQVELRCDVDGMRPLSLVSADYYAIIGATVQYVGSMRVDMPAISVTGNIVTITGVGTYTWNAGSPKVKITIPRTLIIRPRADATLQHLSLNDVPDRSAWRMSEVLRKKSGAEGAVCSPLSHASLLDRAISEHAPGSRETRHKENTNGHTCD